MLFSSITFIYYFLPLLLITYFIVPSKFKNIILLIFSLLFYFLGEPKYIIILILSSIINYYLSKLISKNKYKKVLLIIAIIYNIGSLLLFKYTDFFIANINNIFNTSIPFMYIVMPIGISFYTFQALGYVIDVYNKKHEPAKNIIEFMTYLTLFPQLIAGPIVRYSDIKNELTKRTTSFSKFSEGIKRFVIGLSKKVLIANVLGEFTGLIIEETLISAWLKPIAYTLQIYFDFSGYSDMAIGLGLMFGFRFLENFNYPLIANSITDFWRRWHISLSSWFKDYVYIPLGGNIVSMLKWIRNIFVVWFLTGFWHGASWNFILWGVYFGVILIIEKLLLKKHLDKTKILKYIYTSILIIISFMIFNSLTLNEIFLNLKNMFYMNNIPVINKETIYYIRDYLVIFIIAIISSTPLLKNTIKKIRNTKLNVIINVLEPVTYIILLTLCTAYLIDASFNPFLYFRF
ncbi:MAG: MBOAT family protein [Firmicutes bacterium]|nr:MBOAT family protein [Bacillota bacterium]